MPTNVVYRVAMWDGAGNWGVAGSQSWLWFGGPIEKRAEYRAYVEGALPGYWASRMWNTPHGPRPSHYIMEFETDVITPARPVGTPTAEWWTLADIGKADR